MSDSPNDNDLKNHILKTSPKSSHLKRWLLILVVISVLGAAAWYYLQIQSSSNGGYRYEMEQTFQGNLTVKVTATGTLQPLDAVDMSSETSGTVKEVMVEENDLVKAGQVLLKLDTTTLEAQVKQAQANVEVSKAQVKQAQIGLSEAKTTFQRKEKLLPSKFVSEEELNTARSAYLKAEADLESSKAQLLQMKATLALQQDKLRKATIHSPFDGVVLSREIDPGQTVAASLQAPVLFTLARNLTQMELLLDIDEADVGTVKSGQKATFTVDAYPEETFSATITKVHLASQTVDGVVTYQARLSVDNPDGKLRPGMTSTADITIASVENAILVPNTALRFEPPASNTQATKSVLSQLIPRPPRAVKKKKANNTTPHVWILENNQPVMVDVSTGMTDGVNTQIISGLKLNQAVIVDTVNEKK
ncbi:efflux RND transporter periplasmic adaptor subunit [Thiomicrorhabdus sp. ZW0627]|uniref:efflux RND transporter periplasmic adaptor subunit n=1 Tax=Thiomicrorhabdus sp. ZW0627 TaxID=3039774 RepID=UPI0024365B8D|nr:efflux RND transporter periplasmic adaptor subunit [Thiomicrorhabdus sp. ZW0627]MDG6773266.1 efflux RND transporter periplasmic adaptor subunit [Thiomicrorhabdus sp. ZW0627]